MNTERIILDARESGVALRTFDHIGGLIGACFGADGLIITETEIGPMFFDLRTGLAGEALQKLVNYRVRTAIVIAQPEQHGDRFVELVREHAAHPMVRFLTTSEDARAWPGAV